MKRTSFTKKKKKLAHYTAFVCESIVTPYRTMLTKVDKWKNNDKTQSTGCPQKTVDPESGFGAYKPDNN